MRSRKTILQFWEQRLAARGIDSPRLSIQVLLAHVLGLERIEMLLDLSREISESELDIFTSLALRRESGEPLAYLVGTREFYGINLQVSPDVLIPRPETELLVDQVRSLFSSHEKICIADIGTGSGALALACAVHFPQAHIVAIDVSRPALDVAKQNAFQIGVADRVSFVQGDLLAPLGLDHFQVFLANLPYVPLRTQAEISPEVLDFEPHLALFAGKDGLDCYRRLQQMLRTDMVSGTLLLCEIDPSQGSAMRALFAPKAEKIEILKDCAGHDRVVRVVF